MKPGVTRKVEMGGNRHKLKQPDLNNWIQEQSNCGTGCPERLCNPHHWRTANPSPVSRLTLFWERCWTKDFPPTWIIAVSHPGKPLTSTDEANSNDGFAERQQNLRDITSHLSWSSFLELPGHSKIWGKKNAFVVQTGLKPTFEDMPRDKYLHFSKLSYEYASFQT